MRSLCRSLYISLYFGMLISIMGSAGLAAQTGGEIEQSLRADHAAYLKAKKDLESRISGGELTSTEIADYKGWIELLGNKINQDCLALEKVSKSLVPEDLPCTQFIESTPGPASIDIADEKTVSEKTDNMVDELHSALGEFDEQLLKEQDKIKAQTPRSNESQNQSVAQQGAGGQGEGEQGELGDESENNQNSTVGQNDEVAAAKGSENESSDNENSDTGETPGNRAQTKTPDNIPDGSDDDVVARQLREAAEKETDPELKEKLWEEYRRYKAGKN